MPSPRNPARKFPKPTGGHNARIPSHQAPSRLENATGETFRLMQPRRIHARERHRGLEIKRAAAGKAPTQLPVTSEHPAHAQALQPVLQREQRPHKAPRTYRLPRLPQTPPPLHCHTGWPSQSASTNGTCSVPTRRTAVRIAERSSEAPRAAHASVTQSQLASHSQAKP